MPGGDRTGPAGMGSRTGRGLGYCAGYDNPGFTKGSGRGMARGVGGITYGAGMAWRRGNRRWIREGAYMRGGRGGIFYSQPIYAPVEISTEQRLTILKQDKEYLQAELKGIQNEIEEISKSIESLEKSE